MSEQVGEAHIDVHADATGLAGEVERAADAAARGAQIEMDAELTRGAIRHLQREARRAAQAAQTDVEFGADADFMGIIGQARRAARLARQRVVFEAHLETRGVWFDQINNQFRRVATGAILSAEELTDALQGVGRQADQTGGQFGGMAQIIENSVAAFTARALTQMTAFGLLIGAVIPYVVALVAALGSLIAVAIQASGVLVTLVSVAGTIAGAFLAVKIGTSGIADAFKAQQKALDELDRTGKVSKKTQEELAAAMAKLSPSAREFVDSVDRLRGSWGALQKTVQESLFRDIGSSLEKTAREVLPILTLGFSGLAGVINDGAIALLAWARSADGLATIRGVFSTMLSILPPLVRALGNFGQGFLNLFIGAGPAAQRLMTMLEDVGQSFEDWTARISADGSLDRFLTRAQTALEAIGGLAKTAGGFVLALLDGGGATDEGLLLIENIRAKLEEFTTWLNDPANQPTIQEFWDDVNRNLETLWTTLESIDFAQLNSDLQGLATALGLLAGSLIALSNAGAFTNVFSIFDQLKNMDVGNIDWNATLLSWFGGLNGAITGVLANFAPQIVAAFSTWFSSLATSMASGDFDWAWFAYTLLLPLPAAIIATLTTMAPLLDAGWQALFGGATIDWAQLAYNLLLPLPAAIVAVLNTFAPGIGLAITNMFTMNPPDWAQVAYNLLLPLPAAIVAFLSTMGPQIAAGFTIMFSSVPNIIAGVINMIIGPFGGLATKIILAAGNFYLALYGWLFRAIPAIGVFIGQAVAAFFGLAGKLFANAGNIYGIALGWFSGAIGAARETVAQIVQIFSGLGGLLSVIVSGALNSAAATAGAKGLIAGAAKGMVSGAANGIQITRGPQLRLIGEAGPEAVVPLRKNQTLDPNVEALLLQVAERRGMGSKEQRSLPPIQVTLPTGDPEAAAMAVYNRLVFEGAF